MDRSIKLLVREALMDLPVCIINGDETEYTVRCPFCGDSLNPNHAHMGINIDVDNDDMMLYNCLKCGASGIVDDDLLDELEIFLSSDEAKQLKSYNKKATKLSGRRTIIRTEKFVIPLFSPSRNSDDKLQYLNHRIGANIDYGTVGDYRIILSLAEFMTANEIKKLENVPDWKLRYLEMNYIGFLSSNKNSITFRCIRNDPKFRRYDKVILNPNNQDNATFYSIPSRIDMLYDGEFHIHIAEGTFDILGVRHTVNPQYENQAFYAACGYSYLRIIKFLAKNGLISHMNLHIYADRDKTDWDHLKLLNRSTTSALLEHVYLHRNGVPGQKDYGVTPDLIKDTYRKLW